MQSRKIVFLYTIAIITLFTSCEKAFLAKELDSDPVSVFNEYSDIVNNKFVLKDLLNFDIEQVTDSMKQVIASNPTTEVLDEQFNSLLHRMHDGHTRVGSPNARFTYEYTEGYESIINEELLVNNYIDSEFITKKVGKDLIGQEVIEYAYGLLPQDNSIGYIYIPSFFITLTPKDFDDMFTAVSSASSLIIDVRGNGGGAIEGATNLTKRLIPEAKEIGFTRIISPTDNTKFYDSPLVTEIAAEGVPTFLNKPVAVLVDRSVFSAGTFLCEVLRGTIDPIFIGQRTGGGTSGFIAGYLANGYSYELATSEIIRVTENGEEIRSNDGFEPTIPVTNFTTTNSIDEVIQAAVDAL